VEASGIQWWCSASTAAWTWTWQAYPGVWLLIAALAAGYLVVTRSGGAECSDRRWYLTGLLVLWLALDWPIGALGAGYLAAVHMVQYLMIAIIAPPLLLKGVPLPLLRRIEGSPAERVLRVATNPLVALGLFNAVLIFTHLPGTVDTWMSTQVGSFGIDMMWLVGGLIFWWPVVLSVPERRWFGYPMKMGYLFVAMVANTLPFAFLTYAELPFYGIYELSPPVPGLSAREDQQIAGILMKVGGGAIMWTVITILFFRWYSSEERAES